MNIDLNSSTIAAIREFIDSQTSRGDLKNVALSAGAKADRVMRIKISGNMRDPGYKSKAELMGTIVDTVYEDFEKPEADGILLRMTGNLVTSRKDWIPTEQLQDLERGLAASKLSLSQLTGSATAAVLLESTAEQTRTSDLKEATDLLTKALLRPLHRQARSHHRRHQRLRICLPNSPRTAGSASSGTQTVARLPRRAL